MDPIQGVNLIKVNSAEEMFNATLKNLPVDVAIFSAAVTDFKVKNKEILVEGNHTFKTVTDKIAGIVEMKNSKAWLVGFGISNMFIKVNNGININMDDDVMYSRTAQE